MTKLNQLLAISKGVKATAEAMKTQHYQLLQKSTLLTGISRVYRPLAEDGTQLPAESTRVQVRAEDSIRQVNVALTRLFDVTASIDATNCVAKADIIVDSVTLADDVPATTLLFLEKQLVDIATFVRKLPLLDPSEEWTYSGTSLTWQAEASKTIRSEKTLDSVVLYPHTDKHPAQVKEFTRDVPVGEWTTVKMSGAVPASLVADILNKVNKLTEAVKKAREEANMTTVVDARLGANLLSYLFS